MTEIDFETWCEGASNQLKGNPLWNSLYYRYAMFLYELAWTDCEILKGDFRGREIAKQLIRSVGSISANLEEAYGRGIGTPDHVRILRIALGEARESQGWYWRAKQLLPESKIHSRVDLLNQIISLVVKSIANQKKS
jgi:four helix bundle protein